MHWLLQDKFSYDKKYVELKETLTRFGIPYSLVTTIPFSDGEIMFKDAEPDLSDTKVFTYGSYTLALGAARNYTPGAFTSSGLEMTTLLEKYGDEMFNHDMQIAPLSELESTDESFFIRPVEDTKSFVGEVVTRERFNEWRKNIIEVSSTGYSSVTGDTLSVLAPIKEIHQEVRCFSVNGKVATASTYKLNGQPHFSSQVDQYIIEYAERMMAIHLPDIAVCFDVAITNGIPKVLECNCINASGMYDIDMQKFVMAIEEL